MHPAHQTIDAAPPGRSARRAGGPRRDSLRAAIDRAVRRARRIARAVKTRVAAARREAQSAAQRRRVARGLVGRPAAPVLKERRPVESGGLSIEMWRADDGGLAVRDGRMQRAVFDEFGLDPALASGGIKVMVRRGAVTLSGTVESYPAKLAAERAARRVRKVQQVLNEIQVTPPAADQRSDWELSLIAAQALESNILVPRGKVTATVAAGWVRLAGEVSRGAERRAAEQAVECLVGLRGVRNDVTVKR